MKRIKKTLALLLAAVMVLATGTTAAAAGGTGSLTIKGTKAPADGKPNNVYAYRMFTADVEGASPNEVVTYTMEESFADFFKNLLGNEYASAEASDPDLKNAAADYVADVQLGESTGKVEFAKKVQA